METILQEEEQISLLGKMLYYSAKNLTSRERETYDHLVESLLRKVHKKREVEQRHHSSDHYLLNAQHEAIKNSIRNKSAEDICRMFVEAWNKQDFETEFFCLANCFPMRKKKTTDVNEYVLQRMGKYQDRKNVGPIIKKALDITSSPTQGNKTSIYCVELHKMPNRDLTLHREYEFLYENNAWRIADYETIKSHEIASDRK
jgi:hypothetical protein